MFSFLGISKTRIWSSAGRLWRKIKSWLIPLEIRFGITIFDQTKLKNKLAKRANAVAAAQKHQRGSRAASQQMAVYLCDHYVNSAVPVQ